MPLEKEEKEITLTLSKKDWEFLIQGASFSYNAICCLDLNTTESYNVLDTLVNAFGHYLTTTYVRPMLVREVLKRVASQIDGTSADQLEISIKDFSTISNTKRGMNDFPN